MRMVIRKCGEIEVHEHGEPVETLDVHDPLAILPAFRAYVEFEEGLTPFHLMKALEPWSVVLSEAGWLDFEAWFRAMEKPLLKEVSAPDGERLSGIELHPRITIQGRRRRSGVKKDADLYVNWRPLGRYAVPQDHGNGRIEETCSISFVDPREIGHLPITIVENSAIRGINTDIDSKMSEQSFRCCPTLFDTVVLGFLDEISFHGNPEATQDVADYLKEAVTKIRSGENPENL